MDICAVWKGVVSVQEEGGFLLPLRFTKRQLERYDRGEFIPGCPYARAAASVTMDFFTEQREISFVYACGEIWDWWKDGAPGFDIYEDGVLEEHAVLHRDGGKVVYQRKKKEASQITIYLPCNAEVRVKDLEFGEFRTVPDKTRRLLVLSDSIGQGLMGNSASMGYVQQLARLFDMDILNQSVGGDTYDPEKLDENLAFDPTDILVSMGINDCCTMRDYESLKAHIRAFFNKLDDLYHGRRIVVLTPTAVLDLKPERIESVPETEGCRPVRERAAALDYISSQVREAAMKKGYTLLEGKTLIPELEKYLSDGCHPNDLGFSVMALNVAKAFKP